VNKLDWDNQLEQVLDSHDVSDKAMKGKSTRAERKKRRDVEKAFVAVQKAYAANPTESNPEAFRRQVYGFLGLGILGQILLSLIIRLVVDYLIDQLFSSDEGEQAYGDVHVPAK